MPYFKKNMFDIIESVTVAVRKRIYKTVGSLSAEAWTSKEPLAFNDRFSGNYIKLSLGDSWGALFDCAWFHFKGKTPPEFKHSDGNLPCLLIDVNGEGCIVDNAGNPVQGITSVEQNYEKRIGIAGKRVVRLTAPLEDNLDIWMDAGCNTLLGERGFDGYGKLKQADFALCNLKMRTLFYDFQVLLELLKTLDPQSARYNRILFKAYEAAMIMHDYTDNEIDSARRIILPELEKKGGDASITFSAIGHAHIDLAWLWPIRETIRKAARTFSTALLMMGEYPDYVFGASQPQLYKWVKDYYPELFQRIKERIKDGRWEVQGAMWVESDTNLVSGESLVRQILYGKKFYKKEFDIEIDSLWLPDVFGYSAALPQILKKSKTPYFMTQKLSWNEHNRFPHQTFFWEGIDGSRVLAHMLPEENYNSSLTPVTVKRAEYNYQDSGLCENALLLFGIGDGGGGAGREHLERASRMKNLEGLPPVIQEKSTTFFDKLSKNCDNLKVWQGELYLEKHQGTYTTQAKNKQYNRKMEFALRELEFALTLSDSWCDSIKAEIDEIWEEVLLYQFHDIIPGSSIKRVYDESLERYDILLAKAEAMIKTAYEKLANSQGLIAFNALSWARTIYFEDKVLSIPPLGYAPLSAAVKQKKTIDCGEYFIENPFFRVEFQTDGSISSIQDKRINREILTGATNLLKVYQEEHKSNAWDINLSYLDAAYDVFKLQESTCVIENNVASMKQRYAFKNSKINLTVSLNPYQDLILFDLTVDWKEPLAMLRTDFELNLTLPKSTCEIQFGKISRPNHENTSWDAARFEISAQKWVDLSQPDYGVALLNREKYGYRILRNKIDINLLRSQNNPGINSDQTVHQISYALCPHLGDEIAGDIQKKAYEYNVSPRILGSDLMNLKQPEPFSLFDISEGFIIDTVKQSEDGKATILRIFEPHGKNASGKLTLSRHYNSAFTCDLLENSESELVIKENTIALNANPFEILTIRLAHLKPIKPEI